MTTQYKAAGYGTEGWYEVTPIHMDEDGNQYSYSEQVETAKTLTEAQELGTRIMEEDEGLYTVRIRFISEQGFIVRTSEPVTC